MSDIEILVTDIVTKLLWMFFLGMLVMIPFIVNSNGEPHKHNDVHKCEEKGGIYLETLHQKTKDGRYVRTCMKKDFFVDMGE